MRLIDADAMMRKGDKTMSDYIKREDALNAFSNAFYSGLAAKINEIPSEDVAPVKHGRWVKHGTRNRMTCSCCGDYWEMGLEWTSDNFKGWFKFCPNCGARMDGESND